MIDLEGLTIPCGDGGEMTVGEALEPLGRRNGIYEAVQKAFENAIAVEIPFVVLPGGKSSGGTGLDLRDNETREVIMRRVLGIF